MEKAIKYLPYRLKLILKKGFLLFAFFVFFTSNAWSSVFDAKNSLSQNEGDVGIAMEKAQINTAQQEFMSYVYMALGLGVIFGVAWFTVVRKKKKNGHKMNEKHQVLKYRQSSIYKRYGMHRYQGIKK